MGEVCNRYDYMAEKREALVKWGDHLTHIVRKGTGRELRLARSGTRHGRPAAEAGAAGVIATGADQAL